jgi:uncharacterized membrane protein
MEKSIKIGRIFFGIAIAAVGFQQFFISDFHPMILPPHHDWIPGRAIWSWLSGASFMAAGLSIFLGKNGRTVSIILGAVLFALFLYYIPYEIILDPYAKYLGSWGDAEKELALSGGAFVMAGSFPEENANVRNRFFFTRLFEKLIPYGGIFFSITMISFGIDHFLYTKQVATLVPGWIPYPIFWTYFAAVALIGSGAAIILRFKLKLIATLLGIMILLWFIVLHIPRAIAQPFANKEEEIFSAYSALAFSGIALVIAGKDSRRSNLK